MEIKTSYDAFKVDFEELLEEKQIVTQSNLDASNKGGVKKVCFANASVIIIKSQVVNRQVKVQGQTLIKVVYLNLADELQSFDYISDFVENINTRRIVTDESIDVRGTIVDCVSTVQGEEIKVQTVIQLAVAAIDSQDAKLLTSVENAIYQSDLERIQTFDKYVDELVQVTSEYQTGVNVDSILLYDSKASVVDVKYEIGQVSVLGQVVISILYKSEGIITQKEILTTFDKTFETNSKEMVICPYAVIRDSKLIIQGSEADNTLKMDLDIYIKGALFTIEERDLIVDLYSPQVGVAIQEEYLPYFSKNGIEVSEEKVNGIAILEDGISIKRIISCNVIQNSIVNLLSVPGEIVNEGLIVASVIFEKADQTIDSTNIEMPYAIRISNESLVSGCKLEAQIIVLDIFSKIKRDKEIEVTITMISSICKCNKVIITGIEDVKIGDEIPYSNAGISIYKPSKGESLWDVAKAVGISMDDVKKQNPTLPELMDGSENVVVYRELTM